MSTAEEMVWLYAVSVLMALMVLLANDEDSSLPTVIVGAVVWPAVLVTSLLMIGLDALRARYRA